MLRKQNGSGAHAFSSDKVKEAAKELGRQGGLVGGPARAEAIGARTRTIAIHAACARWGILCYCDDCK